MHEESSSKEEWTKSNLETFFKDDPDNHTGNDLYKNLIHNATNTLRYARECEKRRLIERNNLHKKFWEKYQIESVRKDAAHSDEIKRRDMINSNLKDEHQKLKIKLAELNAQLKHAKEVKDSSSGTLNLKITELRTEITTKETKLKETVTKNIEMAKKITDLTKELADALEKIRILEETLDDFKEWKSKMIGACLEGENLSGKKRKKSFSSSSVALSERDNKKRRTESERIHSVVRYETVKSTTSSTTSSSSSSSSSSQKQQSVSSSSAASTTLREAIALADAVLQGDV